MTRHIARPTRTLATIEHVTTSLNMGGAQAMLAKLVGAEARLPKALWHDVVSLLPPGAMAPAASGGRSALYSVGMKRGLPGPAALLRLLRITGRIRPDLVQGWMYHGNIAASIAGMAQPRRLPVLWNVRHSLADPRTESRSTRALLSLGARLSRQTAAIIYNSRAAARQHEAIGFASERTVHIPNGFDCARYRPDPARRALLQARFGVPAGDIVVAMVARYHPMKDHAMLIDAVATARAAGHPVHLLLVGTDLADPPRVLAERLRQRLPDNAVTLVDERHDVAEWLPGVDIVALSSAWGEAFPNILGEAMACGLPCVATDVGDSGWIMADSGILVPPRDAAAMAGAIVRLVEEGADARRRRGAAARARVTAEFEIGHVAAMYRRLYCAVLEGRPMPDGAVPARAALSDANAGAA